MSSLLFSRRLALFFPVLLLLVTACSDDDPVTPSVLRGPGVAVGAGEAWAEVTLDADGEPASLAAVFTEAALEELPRQQAPPAHEFVLALPAGARVEPYDHITLDWNAHGHAPPGVYDLPHFDVHFYFMSEAQRNTITPFDSVEFDRPLPAAQLAPMYLETPGGVPRMGGHVIDLMSPEVAGTGTFTHTFIYGKYDGRLNFLEPMVSEDFLRGRPQVTAPIRWPQTFGRPGYFPAAYAVTFDAATSTYRVALVDLTRMP